MGSIISTNYTYKPKEYFEAEECRLILDQYNRPTTIIPLNQNVKTFSYETWLTVFDLILPKWVDVSSNIKRYPSYMEDTKNGVIVNLVDGRPINFTYKDDNPSAHYVICDSLWFSYRDQPINKLSTIYGILIVICVMILFPLWLLLCIIFNTVHNGIKHIKNYSS